MTQPDERRTLWEKVGESLQEWYTEAVGWTGEKARIGVKKMDIVGIQHNVKRSMTHLGGRVYDLMQRGVPVEDDSQVQQIVRDLRGFEDELAAREREIDALRGGRRVAEGEAESAPASEEPAQPAPAHAGTVRDAAKGDAEDDEAKPPQTP